MDSMQQLTASELILNADGSVYHLNLLPEELAETVITVGDPDRVDAVSKYFDSIEVKKHKREFVTHTGRLGSKRVSVISTGIGTDNIDIVLNELDALVNIDLAQRRLKQTPTPLNIVRIGTCGGLQADTPEDSYVVSSHGFDFTGLMHFYDYPQQQDEQQLFAAAQTHFADYQVMPHVFAGSQDLINLFKQRCTPGITATCSGFYAPQGRQLRAKVKYPDILDQMQQFQHEGLRIVNFEMETAGIYGLGRVLGHHCCSVNLVVANRVNQRFSQDMYKSMDEMIQYVLSVLG